MKKILGLLLTIAVLLQTVFAVTLTSYAEESAAENDAEIGAVGDSNSFFNYYDKYKDINVVGDIIELRTDSASNINNIQSEIKAEEKCFILNEGSSVQYSFNVKETGLYPFSFRYFNTSDADSNYTVALKLNGASPFEEADNLSLPRLWMDKSSGKFEKDEYGNDILPSQLNAEEWTESYIYDARGFYYTPYFVYLEKGENQISVTAVNNTLKLGSLKLGFDSAVKSYSEYSAKMTEKSVDTVIQEAENMFRKNNSVLYQTYDKTNSATQPQSSRAILLNTVGKSTWNKNGDWISWKPDIKEAGWYAISLRVRQNENQGMKSYRTLMINGKVPFKEAENISFNYDSDWYIKVLGDEKPYKFYLEPGDVVSLAVSSGTECDLLRRINQYSLKLNELYRDVICITGATPDTYRDYMLSDQIPDLETELGKISKELKSVSKAFLKVTGTKGSQVSIIDYITGILDEFSADCDEIPNRLSAFQGLLENLGSLQTTIGKQPLEVDYLAFTDKNHIPTLSNNNWFKQTAFSFKTFIASFENNYNSTNNSDVNTINVWATVGRDQAKIINNLIRNDYNSSNKTKVKLSIVSDGSALIKASLAGKGPDVALLAGVPLELAARGALVPLTKYDFGNLKSEFNDEIWNAMSYNGEIYALPETLTFSALFYRKDILAQYNIEPPQTWDEFYKAMEELQKNNLTVGIPEIDTANYGVSQGIAIFSMLLMQNGGSYYNEKLTKTAFNSQTAFNAFQSWVDMYKLYGNSRDYSFYSRFRTGEMPMAIQLYSSYNQIASAAPEIEGLWSIAPIPSTVKADGTRSMAQVGNATGCYMLKSAVKKGIDKEAFEFMKWWAGSEIQTKYGKELEATMGVAGRYTPANKVALNNLGWSTSEKEVLNKMLDEVILVPQVPGNYLLVRSLTTAFRSAVTGKSRATRALTIADKEINDELKRKRQEFNLD